MPKIELLPSHQKEPVSISYQKSDDGYSVLIGQTTYHVALTMTEPNAGLFRLNQRTSPFYCYEKDGRLQLWYNGKTYWLEKILPQAKRGNATGIARVAGDVKAPMPGTVLKINVKPGDTVTAHQPLVIMESMKMEMSLTAPADATVEAVLCSESQLVDMGAILVKLKPVE